ncbi:MAG: anaerobic ribonucleoside-triphosphate reductase activating protein [Treponema sp.]|nr:anaerobic ribonucleoside-triphosphate reductase activating protein [Treponema sp.]
MPSNFDAPAGVLIKTTLVDYPETLACAFFLYGCNMRCPYCYNTDLVNCKNMEDAVSLNTLFSHLEKRKNILKGLVISGGEALLNQNLSTIIKKAKEEGYKVKLDTNGLLPEKLSSLLKDKFLAPDFIALDIKTSPEKYFTLLGNNKDAINFKEKAEKNIKESIKILSELPAEKREFRTVLVPTLINEKDISEIAKLLPKDASWKFSPFMNEHCLSLNYEKLTPYTDTEINELIKKAKSLLPGAELR